jgi:hypothetical protein
MSTLYKSPEEERKEEIIKSHNIYLKVFKKNCLKIIDIIGKNSLKINELMKDVFRIFNIHEFDILYDETSLYNPSNMKVLIMFMEAFFEKHTIDEKREKTETIMNIDISFAYLLDFAYFNTILSFKWRNSESTNDKDGFLTATDMTDEQIEIYNLNKDIIENIRSKVVVLLNEIIIMYQINSVLNDTFIKEVEQINEKYIKLYKEID